MVCVSVGLSVDDYSLGLQATRRLMKDINIFSATSARKMKSTEVQNPRRILLHALRRVL